MRRSRCHDGSSRLCSRHTTRIVHQPICCTWEESDYPLLLVSVDSRGRPCSTQQALAHSCARQPRPASKQQASRRSAPRLCPTRPPRPDGAEAATQMRQMGPPIVPCCHAGREDRTITAAATTATVALRRASQSNHVEVKHWQMQGGTLLKHRETTSAPLNPCTPSCDTVLYTVARVVLLPAGCWRRHAKSTWITMTLSLARVCICHLPGSRHKRDRQS
jgi:hypothetical protein